MVAGQDGYDAGAEETFLQPAQDQARARHQRPGRPRARKRRRDRRSAEGAHGRGRVNGLANAPRRRLAQRNRGRHRVRRVDRPRRGRGARPGGVAGRARGASTETRAAGRSDEGIDQARARHPEVPAAQRNADDPRGAEPAIRDHVRRRPPDRAQGDEQDQESRSPARQGGAGSPRRRSRRAPKRRPPNEPLRALSVSLPPARTPPGVRAGAIPQKRSSL